MAVQNWTQCCLSRSDGSGSRGSGPEICTEINARNSITSGVDRDQSRHTHVWCGVSTALALPPPCKAQREIKQWLIEIDFHFGAPLCEIQMPSVNPGWTSSFPQICPIIWPLVWLFNHQLPSSNRCVARTHKRSQDNNPPRSANAKSEKCVDLTISHPRDRQAGARVQQALCIYPEGSYNTPTTTTTAGEINVFSATISAHVCPPFRDLVHRWNPLHPNS